MLEAEISSDFLYMMQIERYFVMKCPVVDVDYVVLIVGISHLYFSIDFTLTFFYFSITFIYLLFHSYGSRIRSFECEQ